MSKELQAILDIKVAHESEFNLEVEEILGEELARPLLAGLSYTDGKAKMELGYEGMPKESKKLVGLGIFEIKGEWVHIHKGIYAKRLAFKKKQSDLLSLLKEINENKSGLSEEEISKKIDDFGPDEPIQV